MSPDAPPPAAAPAEEEILAGLNDEQRAAVTHEGGPLLIVAGAGTGKTQVITRRIAWLITTRRAKPEQILALTFTDKAAAEMETRVDQLVPYGLVGATLSTFHAFCDRLVREHAVELGLTSQLRVESQAEILVFLRERLFELGLERYLPLGNPEAHVRALASVFDRARDEDVSPEAYAAFAEKLLADAGGDDEKLDRARAEVEKARAYGKYQKLLLSNGRVDFGSQISLALRLLRERPHVRREVLDRFRWLLVDEFQDTNHVQFELVKWLAGERRNLTVVGDDDQSIYRFRGAKVENLIGFRDAYPDTRVVLLKRNYRSGQRILDLAHKAIQHNNPERLEAKLGFDKRLVTERRDDSGAPLEGDVQLRTFASGSDEADAVAREIAEGVAAGRSPRAYAVLARAHGHLDAFALALRAQGVRFRRVGQRGLYVRPEVSLCLNALRALADPRDGAASYFVLGHELFGADLVELAELGAESRRAHRPLLRLAADAARAGRVSEPTRVAALRWEELHRQLEASALRRSSAEVLYEFVADSGLLERFSDEDRAEHLEAVQNLNKLFGIVTRIGPLLKRDRVDAFVTHLDLLIEMGDDPTAAEVETDEEAVSLLTAHNAKGLEFDVVFLVNLVEQRFPGYRRGDSMPFPPELRHGGGDEGEEHYREERRLFYVGLTRARERLVLTHAVDYGGKRAARPSRFLVEALDLPAAPKGARGASPREAIERHAPVPEPPAVAPAPVPDDAPVTLSHSQIDAWRACPLRYYFAHVANVPLAPRWNLAYGNAVHHAIRVYLQHRLKGLPIAPDDVLAAYREAWSSQGFLTPEHEDRVFEAGADALRAFVDREERSGVLPLAVEMDFKFKLGHDVVIGRWDRIDERRDGIALVDYKTSEVDDDEKAAKRVKDSLEDGQLGLYALAYVETRGVQPARAELHFVGSQRVGSAEVEAEHVERARARVAEAAAGIRSAQFPPKPDTWTCATCDYGRICRHNAARGA